MLGRLAAVSTLALATTASAQSFVRPLPGSSLPNDGTWLLVSDTAPPTDLFPSTSTERERITARAPQSSSPYVDLEISARARTDGDFTSGTGSADVARAGWDARIGWKTSADHGFVVTLHTEASSYGFSGATGLIPGVATSSPLNDVYETSLGALLCSQASERTSWFTSAEVGLSGEDEASLGKALTLAAVGGVRYRANDDLTLQCGLAARTMHEDDPWVVPYLGFDLRLGDRVRLSAEGSNIKLSAELTDAWSMFALASYEMRQYRLNESNPLPDGTMRDQEIDLGAGIDWRPNETALLRLEGGITAWQEFEFFDRDGRRVSETETDAAPFVGFSLQFGF